jgi:hypothetical protein
MIAGCAPVNEEVGLINAPPLPALDPDAPTIRIPAHATPSITSHDRSNWGIQTVILPLKQVEHRPTYTSDIHFASNTPRERGEYPTAQTALDVPTPNLEQVAEGVVGPAYAGILVIWWPVEWIANNRPPWKIRRSPEDNYAVVPPIEPAESWHWIGVSDQIAP